MGGDRLLADVYVAEQYLSNILQYLHCCEMPSNGYSAVSGYPNLQQVFLLSRTYGYANNSYATYGKTSSCLNPEPFAPPGGIK
jgi:hypothetical protein